MILEELYNYGIARLSDGCHPGMEPREIETVIVIDPQGRFLRFESKRIDKKRCASFNVPKGVKRTSGSIPNTLWDNAKYVLGIGDKKGGTCNQLFAERVMAIAERHPNDPSISALSLFYATPMEEHFLEMNNDPIFEDVKNSKGNISFRLEQDDELIAEKSYLLDGLESDDDPKVEGMCLVTGKHSPLIRTMPATPIPGNSPLASLVSFQVSSGYDSYGHKQAYNAPISESAASAIVAAINKLKDKDSRNKARIGNRMFFFWGNARDKELNQEIEDSFSSFLDFSPSAEDGVDDNVDRVARLFKSIYSGTRPTSTDDRFFIFGLAPNAGRIAVVCWSDTSLKEFARNISSHFDDMEIIDTRKPESRRPYRGILQIISAVTLKGKISDATPNLPESVADAIFNNTLYPFPLYTSSLERIRAELSDNTVTIARAAILKAYINRTTRNNPQHKPLTIMLDKTNTNPGYLCGRFAAVLEKIQKDAGNGDSIRSRFMGSASATPSAVFPAMLNLSLHHDEKLSEGSRIFYDQIKQEILDKLSADGFPSHLDLMDQGRFFVGYYHQRADFYTKKDNSENN